MNEIWVVNASPVITLAKAGYLDLLTVLASEVLLTDAVVSEILAGSATDPEFNLAADRRKVESMIPELGKPRREKSDYAINQRRN